MARRWASSPASFRRAQARPAVAAPDVERGSVVKAVIVLKPGHAISDALTREIQDHVKSVTAPYKYPRIVEYRDELPKGITGKILRRTLRDESKTGSAQ